ARRNPDGRTLSESVPADLYARWAELKPRYIGRNAGIERWRPVFAAQELYEAAMRRAGLSQANVVSPVVAAAARRHGVPRISTQVEVRVSDPKAMIREFNRTTLADTDCFAKTLARIEGDLDAMRRRANAWAIGDVAALRDLPMEDQYVACMRAFTGNAVAQKIGFGDVSTRSTATWVAAAEAALQANTSTFATLPIPFLLREKGVLATLRAKGYAVEAPDE
ncbi:MAG TPA: TraB/GumN family protein, partial [Luteimonas sp.]|nr:TraB/GumN family protein [Luteimonas sp.]